jgi:hypothetical protein
MAFPYLVYFVTGRAVTGWDRMSGARWQLRVERDRYGLLWPFVCISTVLLVHTALRIVARLRCRASYRADEAWLRSRPFAVEGYLEALAQHDEDGFSLQVQYRGDKPAQDLLDAALRALSDGTSLQRDDESDVISGSVRSEWDADGRNGYKFSRLVHRLVDDVLCALHRDYPIEKLVVART